VRVINLIGGNGVFPPSKGTTLKPAPTTLPQSSTGEEQEEEGVEDLGVGVVII